MKKEIKLSVIVPVYNAQAYLSECIESLLCQTFQMFELILVDDGSKDRSGSICDDYAAKDKRIRVIHQKNQGVSAARNAGVRCADGVYTAFVDADDWVDADYLMLLLCNMEPGGMAAAGFVTGYGTGNRGKTVMTLTKEEAQISVFSGSVMGGFPWGKLFDTNLLIQNGLLFDEEIAIGEDLLFVVQYIYYTNHTISYLAAEPYHYRIRDTGAVNKRFRKHSDFDVRELTEADAIIKAFGFLVDKQTVKTACKLRWIKAMVNTLRTMEANRFYDGQYDKMKQEVRKNCLFYIRAGGVLKSSKLSVCLSAISPGLELAVWQSVCKKPQKEGEND